MAVLCIITSKLMIAAEQDAFLFLALDLLIDLLLQLDESRDVDEAVLGAHDARNFQQTEDDVSLIVVEDQVFRLEDHSLPDL